MVNSDPDPGFLESLSFEPLTIRNWEKFTGLFGERGACGNCWCMYYRLPISEFREGKFEDGNKNAMHQLVLEGKPAGILGIYEGQAIAWCAFAPREDFSRLANSRVHKRIDAEAVWSIPCFFIHKDIRLNGVSVQLLRGVIRYAQDHGIRILEAYPVIPTKPKLPDSFAWTGLYKSFERAGFEIADRSSVNRPMMRFYMDRQLSRVMV